ncbi:hypothetical protein SDC9_64638 [bioreactor metagenome]|uniref:Uncharacterized protein n=1 Tax=bioreactor metagenome TaxID=1076179 RepID=A0A644XPV0_9ZZZZ
MIPADCFVVIRCNPIVERVGCHIQYTVIFGGVLQNMLIGWCLRKDLLFVQFSSEIAVVEVPFVYCPHIGKTKD